MKISLINNKKEKVLTYQDVKELPFGTVVRNDYAPKTRYVVVPDNYKLSGNLLMIMNYLGDEVITIPDNPTKYNYVVVDEDYEVTFKCSEL